MLVVLNNSHASSNDWEHSITVMRHCDTPVGHGSIGMDIMGPAPGFAGVARFVGWHAEGRIENPADIAPALKRAIARVDVAKPAFIDVITQHTG